MMSASARGHAPATIANGSWTTSAELQHEIEQFLFYEAELLDDRRYREWYELLTDDLQYWMPTRMNRSTRELDREIASRDMMAHFDETKESMGWRVTQLESGTHWAEDPPSRTRHLVTNVRIQAHDADGEHAVRSNFLCYRNRRDGEVDLWAGQRDDLLRATSGGYRIARRTIILDQDVILSKNLSVFL